MYIYDFGNYTVLKTYNFYDLDEFDKQEIEQFGLLNVFTVVPNWNASLHVLTNFGIYVFTFHEEDIM